MNTMFSHVAQSAELKEPIRAELFGVERLEQHAASLATAQVVTEDSRVGRLLTPRVLENGRVLVSSYQTIARTIRDEQTITPAAEWFVDNFHIVDEQLREIIYIWDPTAPQGTIASAAGPVYLNVKAIVVESGDDRNSACG